MAAAGQAASGSNPAPGRAAAGRTPIYYTFGNHMHWVDMEWLWGTDALSSSVHDMLRFSAETGARGNINFDAAGYEKLAAEAPETLAALRAAIASGQIEVVSASYGQPYGLFQGGESNVRQRVYGVRTARRLFGVRPRAFWEEEFDFFPQLPQMLAGLGFEYASLFFQWTWHTPVVPQETVAAAWWEGIDGSRLLTATRNALNLHQWPEDVFSLLQDADLCEGEVRGILQWLELLPSPDWMCRSELMMPPLRQLMDSTECEIRFVTLSEYLAAVGPDVPARRYTLDDVYHGVSLGKNGDLFRRLSREAEDGLLAAESLAAVAGLLGRPYASWDVYPAWELEESWRQLLSAQHHDNDECEALCGHVGRQLYAYSAGLSANVARRTLALLAQRASGPAGRIVAYNPLGWPRAVAWRDESGRQMVEPDVPGFGCRVLDVESSRAAEHVEVEESAEAVTLRRGALSVTVDRRQGVITDIASPEFPGGAVRPGVPLADLQMTCGGRLERFEPAEVAVAGAGMGPAIRVRRTGREGGEISVTISLAAELPAVDIEYASDRLPRPDGGVGPALRTRLAANLSDPRLLHDHPYAISEIRASGIYLRKYPTGDWMTSPQVYEEVRGPFTALQLLDICDDRHGLLYLHDGNQAFQRGGDAVDHILSLYDPWDEDYFVDTLAVRVRLVPHGPLTLAERWRLAQEFRRPALLARADGEGGDLPASWGHFVCEAPGVVMTALYREPESAGAGWPSYAGRGLGVPYVLRLVELNGQAGVARLTVPGPVAAAFRTNLLGEIVEPLAAAAVPSGSGPKGRIRPYRIEVPMRAHEIATVYLDLEPGRKEARGLDERRSVWATAHRVDAS